jgi:cytochrome c
LSKNSPRLRHAATTLGLIGIAAWPISYAAVDEEAARALAKKSDCFKCHRIDKKKDGPAWQEVAKKYRGKADAESKLYTHMTTAPIVKIDGEEENHQIVKTKKDPEIYNLIRFILSLPSP